MHCAFEMVTCQSFVSLNYLIDANQIDYRKAEVLNQQVKHLGGFFQIKDAIEVYTEIS